MIRFVCFYLRIVADEERRVEEYVAQRDQAVDAGTASDEDASTGSEYSDGDSDIEGTIDSNDNDSVVPQRQPRRIVQADKIKDARELFTWRDNQKALAMQL
ncbi:hypothetical protein AA0112_g12203 [Alternaria arborescens]|nr:hypothetical protein AA0112_g12203 [Alternaria arborescens]